MSGQGAGVLARLRALRRMMPGPLLIRGIAFGAGLAGIAVALPTELRVPGALLFGAILAALAAIAPGSMFVILCQLGALGLWFAGTVLGSDLVTTQSVTGLACALYTQHSACALAAAVPLDAVVVPAVLARWSLRTLWVIFVMIAVEVAVVILPERIGARPALVFPLLGVVGVIFVSGVLAYLALRRPRRGAG